MVIRIVKQNSGIRSDVEIYDDGKTAREYFENKTIYDDIKEEQTLTKESTYAEKVKALEDKIKGGDEDINGGFSFSSQRINCLIQIGALGKVQKDGYYNGCNVNRLLYLAAQLHHFNAFMFLLKALHPNGKLKQPNHIMCFACGAKLVNRKVEEGSVDYAHFSIFKFAISKGADIHIYKELPLRCVSLGNASSDITDYLFKNNVNIHIMNNKPFYNATLPSYARDSVDTDAFPIIREYDLSFWNNEKIKLLKDHEESLKHLEKQFDLRFEDDYIAKNTNSFEVLEYFNKRGCCFYTDDEMKLMEYSVYQDYYESGETATYYIKKLVKSGVNIHVHNDFVFRGILNNHCFRYHEYGGPFNLYLDLADFLLEYGADINAFDGEPLFIAIKWNLLKDVKYLTKRGAIVQEKHIRKSSSKEIIEHLNDVFIKQCRIQHENIYKTVMNELRLIPGIGIDYFNAMESFHLKTKHQE